ncbi:hypothetical protein IG631_14169 [Alternaria alternata]|nr:hypothetical protein IG631_14169 [Alternaria alternata]
MTGYSYSPSEPFSTSTWVTEMDHNEGMVFKSNVYNIQGTWCRRDMAVPLLAATRLWSVQGHAYRYCFFDRGHCN